MRPASTLDVVAWMLPWDLAIGRYAFLDYPERLVFNRAGFLISWQRDR